MGLVDQLNRWDGSGSLVPAQKENLDARLGYPADVVVSVSYEDEAGDPHGREGTVEELR